MRFILAVVACVSVFPVDLLAQSKTTKVKGRELDYEAAVKEYIKENANDASRVEFVKFSNPFYARGWKYMKDGGIVTISNSPPTIYVKYRTTNAVGALILVEDVFLFGDSGRVVLSMPANKLRPPSAVSGDPFMESFLDQFR